MRYLAIAAAVLIILMGVIFSTAGKRMMQTDGGAVKEAALPEPTSEGALMFDRFCSQCHGRPETTVHTAQEWPRVVERMKKNISSSGKQMPDQRQTTVIIDYLTRNAG